MVKKTMIIRIVVLCLVCFFAAFGFITWVLGDADVQEDDDALIDFDSQDTTLACQEESGHIYFAQEAGLMWTVKGMNGNPDCIIFRDTEGNKHQLCTRGTQKDVCTELDQRYQKGA